MVKNSSFLLIASIWVFTVLCVSELSVAAATVNTGTDADPFNGNIKNAFQAFSDISKSSNVFVKYFHDEMTKYVDDFDKNKKLLQYGVTEGTKMEKKLRNISLTLKNFTVPFTTELQSELEEIEKHAAAELKKLREVGNVDDIDAMEKQHKNKYAAVRGQIEEISKLALEVEQTADEENKKTLSDKNFEKAKPKAIELIKTVVPAAFAMKKDADTISNKMKIASDAFSNIRDDLVKMEQMEYNLLISQKHFKTDATYLIHSSVAQISFAIMFGMIF